MIDSQDSSGVVKSIVGDLDEAQRERSNKFEKNIFFYWHDGYENAIDIAKIAFEMAKITNNSYKIHFIGNNNINEYFRYRSEIFSQATLELKEATFSDLLRCYLVCRYGGIWMDASCLALNCFDSWLDPALSHGEYFLWKSDSFSDRRVMSWFLAGKRGAIVPGEVCKAMARFILQPRDSKLEQTFYPERYCRRELIGPDITDMRAIAEIEKKGKYPYFLMHYIWNDIVNNSVGRRAELEAIPRIPIQIAKLDRRKFSVGELVRDGASGRWIDRVRVAEHPAIPDYVKAKIVSVLRLNG